MFSKIFSFIFILSCLIQGVNYFVPVVAWSLELSSMIIFVTTILLWPITIMVICSFLVLLGIDMVGKITTDDKEKLMKIKLDINKNFFSIDKVLNVLIIIVGLWFGQFYWAFGLYITSLISIIFFVGFINNVISKLK